MSQAIEDIAPVVRGELEFHPQAVHLITANKQRFEFPAVSRVYLQGLIEGLSIRQIVRSQLERGERVDFSILRKTLMALGATGAFSNYDAFVSRLTDLQGMAHDPFLPWPLLSTPLTSGGKGLMATFELLALAGLAAAGVFLAYLAVNHPWALWLEGLTLLSQISLWRALWSLLRHAPSLPRVNASLSPLGISFDAVINQDDASATAEDLESLAYYEKRKAQIVDALPLFQNVPRPMMEELKRSVSLVTIKRGLYVCRRGEQSNTLFLVLQGRVGVFKRFLTGNRLIVELKTGSVFGEGGFFFSRPRDADIVTLEDSILCRLRRPQQAGWENPLDELTADAFRKGIWAYQALAGSKLFNKLPQDTLRLILSRGNVVEALPDEWVIQQGKSGQDFYVVIQGLLQVLVDGERVRDLKATDFFGEVALIRQTRRTATVKALEKSLLFRISGPVFMDLLAENLELACFLEKVCLRYIQSDADMRT